MTLIISCFPGELGKKVGMIGEVKAAETINDPTIVANSSMDARQTVTWDCVWFGSYPQTEIVDKAETCGIYGQSFAEISDYEVNTSIYSALKSASGWDSNGDITMNGTKYRRIKKGDATSPYLSGHSGYYNWNDSNTYHYFRYDPIKWRVLDTDGSSALLLADKALDAQQYNTVSEPVTWETSTIRSWLNGYEASSNQQNMDYRNKNFMDSAFTQVQQGGILTSSLTNADNIKYGTEGGNDTSDKIFLLSESEVCTDAAKSYGFVSRDTIYDEARKCKSSTYSKAMGTWSQTDLSYYAGNCWWWLRSPGAVTNQADKVSFYGYVYENNYVDGEQGVRPALRLNLASTNLYSYAGTVSSGNRYPIDLKEDVWNFRNPDKGGISYQVYKDIFGEVKGSIAYLKGGKGDGGLCYGMAQTVLASYLGFPKISSYESIGGFTHPEKLWDVQSNAYNYQINSSAMDLIRHAFVYQYTFKSTFDSSGTKDDLEGLYQAAIDFQGNGGEPVSITMSSGSSPFSKGYHELAVTGVHKGKDAVEIHVYDCNMPRVNTLIVLYGKPGSFTGKWEYLFYDNNSGNYIQMNHSEDGNNSHLEYRTVTNDFINTYKSKMGISRSVNAYAMNNEDNNLMLAISKNAQGLLCYNGETMDINELYDCESDKVFPVKVASGDDKDSGNILCWLAGNENTFSCQEVSADSEITFSGNGAAVSVKASNQSDISADPATNTVGIAGLSGTEFTVDYDYIDNGVVNRVEVSGVSEGDVTVVPADGEASVDGASNVTVNKTSFKLEKESEQTIEDKGKPTTTTSQKKATTKVSRIILTGISKKIVHGKKIKLTVTILPKNAANKKLKWSTSNKKLATVTQSGLVKISKKAKPGKTVKITAAATDGSGKKQVWAIKVMKGAVKKITVKGYKKTLKAGKTMKLKAVVKTTKGKPVNKKLKWTSLSPKYATVTQTGKVKAKPAGKGKTVKIKVESTDGTNKSVVKKIKIK